MLAAAGLIERRKRRRKAEAIQLRRSHPTHATCRQFAERHGLEVVFESSRATTWRGPRSGRMLSLSMHDEFAHLQLQPRRQAKRWSRFSFQRFQNTDGTATTGDPEFDAVIVIHERMPSQVFAALDADLRGDIMSFCDKHDFARRGGIVAHDGVKAFLQLALRPTEKGLIEEWEGVLERAETIVERMELGDCGKLIELSRQDPHLGVQKQALIRLFSDYADQQRAIDLAPEHLDDPEPHVAGLAALTAGPTGYEQLLEAALSGTLLEVAPPERLAPAILDAFVANPTQPRGTLGRILLHPGNRELVEPIALGLGQSGLDSALDVLLAAAQEMPDPWDLASLLDGIVLLAPAQAEVLLLRMLTDGEEGDLGVRLLRVAERIGGPEAVPVVKTYANGQQTELAAAAEVALEMIRLRLDGIETGGLALSEDGGGQLTLNEEHGGLAIDDQD